MRFERCLGNLKSIGEQGRLIVGHTGDAGEAQRRSVRRGAQKALVTHADRRAAAAENVVFERDVARLRTVLADAGIDPDLLVDGLDPVTALARWVEDGVAPERIVATLAKRPHRAPLWHAPARQLLLSTLKRRAGNVR